MRRRLFNVLAVVSLVLWMATALMWARSYAACEVLFWCNGDRKLDCATSRGDLELAWEWAHTPGQLRQYAGRHYEAVAPMDFASQRPWQGQEVHGMGFHFGTQVGYLGSWYALIIPLWFIGVLTAILPARCGWKSWRSMTRKIQLADRIMAHRCMKCGYDLRASPDRCPECGVVPK